MQLHTVTKRNFGCIEALQYVPPQRPASVEIKMSIMEREMCSQTVL